MIETNEDRPVSPPVAETAKPGNGSGEAIDSGNPASVPVLGPSELAEMTGEWSTIEPTAKRMGLARLTLDEGVRTTVVGHLYGLDFEIENAAFDVRVFFDYYNRRLKVLDYRASDYRALAQRLTFLAKANDFDKIFVKARKNDWQTFLCLGFMLEGILKYCFRGEDAYVLSRFGSPERLQSDRLIEESDLIESIMAQPRKIVTRSMPEGYHLVMAEEQHIPGLVALYRRVFKTYPSPLTHPDYIQQTMERNVLYRAILAPSGEVVSAASAEIGHKHGNAELTDCATLRTERGHGLMPLILAALEEDLRERGIISGYTLARARSVGMNRVFYRLGYEYSGRLINNCDIYGQYEDMNIWVKLLGDDTGAGAPPL